MTACESAATLQDPSNPRRATIGGLTEALVSERSLLDDLVAVMLRQRQAVREDDLDAIENGVFTTHRLLTTLGEARKRRRMLVQMLAGSDGVGIEGLEKALGMRMSPALAEALDSIRATATTLSREVAINRQLLREALEASDAYVRMLYTPDTAASYPAEIRRTDAGSDRPGGALINRTI